MIIFKKQKEFLEVLKEYLLMREIEVSRHTYCSDLSQIKCFVNWLAINKYQTLIIKNINQSIISSFFVYLAKEQDLDRTTCQKYYINLRMIFAFALEKKYIKQNPFNHIVFPCKKEDKGAQVIPTEECIQLLTKIKESDFQLYVACMCQYYCFIRPGFELRLLLVREIDLNLGIITIPAIRAKNRQAESVTIPIQLLDILKVYGIETADKHHYVFGKYRVPGTIPHSINMLTYRFNKYRDELGLSKKYKFYSMKHTGAMALHHAGCPMRNEMDQLRHKNLAASQHYLKKHGGLIDNKIRYDFPELKLVNSSISIQVRKRTKHNFSVIEN